MRGWTHIQPKWTNLGIYCGFTLLFAQSPGPQGSHWDPLSASTPTPDRGITGPFASACPPDATVLPTAAGVRKTSGLPASDRGMKNATTPCGRFPARTQDQNCQRNAGIADGVN